MKPDLGLGYVKATKTLQWFDTELPLSKVSPVSASISTVLGAIIGAICSLIVNCALVELSISPFFTTYFGITFFIIGIVILWRLNSPNSHTDANQKYYLRLFGLMIVGSGVLCFFLRRNWFVHLPMLVKTLMYTILGVSISFALTFTIVDLINYFISMLETSVAKPLVESKSQIHLILAIAISMGAIFGFTFGFLDLEDEVAYHIKLALMKEESYTYPIGILLGGLAGFGNEYLRQQESWRFNKDNAYDIEI